MKMLLIELKKEKRTGILALCLFVGIIGAVYAIVNFGVRGDALLSMPLNKMDILLTQLYGMIMVLNMFGIIVATSMIYNMEFRGNAIKKMHMMPISVPGIYLSKFLILTFMIICATAIQYIALIVIGNAELPEGTFIIGTLVRFAVYSFVTTMPVVSFMLMISSRCANMWIPIGIGVAGFLSGMSIVNIDSPFVLIHPFAIMLKPAVSMTSNPDILVTIIAVIETIVFMAAGLGMAKYLKFE